MALIQMQHAVGVCQVRGCDKAFVRFESSTKSTDTPQSILNSTTGSFTCQISLSVPQLTLSSSDFVSERCRKFTRSERLFFGRQNFVRSLGKQYLVQRLIPFTSRLVAGGNFTNENLARF